MRTEFHHLLCDASLRGLGITVDLDSRQRPHMMAGSWCRVMNIQLAPLHVALNIVRAILQARRGCSIGRAEIEQT